MQLGSTADLTDFEDDRLRTSLLPSLGRFLNTFNASILALTLIAAAEIAAPAFGQPPDEPIEETEPDCLLSATAPTFDGNGPNGLHGLPHAERSAPHTAFHGQLLVGRTALYLYHLPLFMDDPLSHPHNFQVVLEVTLPPEDETALSEDKIEHPNLIYSATPETFEQSALVLDYPGYSPLRALGVSVFRGHFEREPNKLVIENTTAMIDRVVHFREFAVGGAKLEPLTYVVFGRNGESFMAHLLTAPPDFDQVLSVALGDSGLSEELLRQGVYASFPGRANGVLERLRAGESVSCRFDPGEDSEPIEVALSVTADLYCEVGEVGQVGFNNSLPCE